MEWKMMKNVEEKRMERREDIMEKKEYELEKELREKSWKKSKKKNS